MILNGGSLVAAMEAAAPRFSIMKECQPCLAMNLRLKLFWRAACDLGLLLLTPRTLFCSSRSPSGYKLTLPGPCVGF